MVVDTQTIPITVKPSVAYNQVAAEAAAKADRTWLNSPAGFLAALTAAGGTAKRLADSIKAGTIILQPLTIRHDSAAHVAGTHGGVPNPEETAYFAGETYAASPNTGTFVAATGAGAFSRLGGVLATAAPHLVAVNRTKDVAAGAKRPAAELIGYTVHEATHALDVQVAPDTAKEFAYKTEFRAYWNDGRFNALSHEVRRHHGGAGAALQAGAGDLRGDVRQHDLQGREAGVRQQPGLPPDGRQPAVPRWDQHHPVAAARRLAGAGQRWRGAQLRDLPRQGEGVRRRRSGSGAGRGRADATERGAVRSSRAWRDLVESKVPVVAQAATIKSDLAIP